jgi:hypothetical protein
LAGGGAGPLGPGGPTAPGGGKPGAKPDGAPPISEREATARRLLEWDWNRAFAPRTSDGPAVLSEDGALSALADGDPRPLLVLRECENCAGTYDAFLSREFDNERTILLGRWFHAVKLGKEVLGENDPFHALFAGKKPPHLFVATADGKTRTDLDGSQSQAKLWKAMTGVLGKSYRKDPEAAVKSMQRLLDKLDVVEYRLAELDERVLEARAQYGAEAKELQDLQADIERATAERLALLEEGKVIDDLGLKAPPPAR